MRGFRPSLFQSIISRLRIICAGTPATSVLSGMPFVTTAPAAAMTLFPMVTPERITAFAPIRASFPMGTGPAKPGESLCGRRSRCDHIIRCKKDLIAKLSYHLEHSGSIPITGPFLKTFLLIKSHSFFCTYELQTHCPSGRNTVADILFQSLD